MRIQNWRKPNWPPILFISDKLVMCHNMNTCRYLADTFQSPIMFDIEMHNLSIYSLDIITVNFNINEEDFVYKPRKTKIYQLYIQMQTLQCSHIVKIFSVKLYRIFFSFKIYIWHMNIDSRHITVVNDNNQTWKLYWNCRWSL